MKWYPLSVVIKETHMMEVTVCERAVRTNNERNFGIQRRRIARYDACRKANYYTDHNNQAAHQKQAS
jgi:hypothetical protein